MFKIAKICVFVLFLHFILECSGESKRLLLTDQDLINGRFEQLEKTLREQQALITSLSQRLQVKEEYGSTYVRWGKSSCRTEADLVYSGYMTGQIYYTNSAQFGGPANNLCLPNNPELSNKTVKGNSYLYGTEFEETNFGADAV